MKQEKEDHLAAKNIWKSFESHGKSFESHGKSWKVMEVKRGRE